jgi:hypothetical protein
MIKNNFTPRYMDERLQPIDIAWFDIHVPSKCQTQVYVMHDAARYHYDHRIVPVKTERYSLTFRYLAQEEPVRSFAPSNEEEFASLMA